MTDDLKDRLLTWHPGQDEEALREEALARITDLEARLAAAEADVNRLREGEARLSLLLNETALARDAAETGEDALAVAGGKFHRACNAAWAAGEPSHKVCTMLDEADRFGAALAAYEARRKG